MTTMLSALKSKRKYTQTLFAGLNAMNPSFLQDRLRQFMKDHGLTATALARQTGVSRASVSMWLSGTTKSLGAETTAQLAKAYGIDDALWLATGQRIDEDNLPLPTPKPADGHVVRIPQYEAAGAMGDGLELRDQPGVIHSWNVSKEWLNKNVRHFSSTENLCIVTGFGDSMRPMFNPGDPLLVDAGIKTVEFDAVYFFRVEGEGFIKRLQRVPGRGLLAISENSAYREWTIDKSMDFEVFGRVLKVWRSEDF
ncbi:LexA family transcriptional regulator [Achromobacter xylosoxidans]|uniref:LexA family transcriptional regulator n=1 Tax=Alcaligenes xylosoxydans xylosoxydans TaxID=85698 RepID=UPI00244830C2|nr:S24 family peptidase [Achromobacter xylosoxidans]MDH0519955.1 helix-turn-helix domain-containing protein [Achromobacter xylosoxidans]MDH0543851.1 helix-turn-helix domain-containing protein [Achromobacter xylosoxidans]